MLAPIRDISAQSLLVILPTWVGDFVMATPALRAIRRRYPAAHVAFLAEPNLLDLIRGGDWMDEVIAWPDRARRMPWHREYRALVRDLRARRFDLAVLFPNAFRAALLAWQAGVKRRVGYARDGRSLLLTDPLPVNNRRLPGQAVQIASLPPGVPYRGRYVPMPLVEYYADLVEALGCERPGDTLELATTSDCDESLERRLAALGVASARPRVVIAPGAKFGASKCWHPDRFAALADRLIDALGATVIVACGPGEEPIARAIASAATRGVLVFDNPRPTLGELKSLVRRSDLLVCNDTGPRHFARAFGVPVVTVFGPTFPEWTHTSYPAERIVRIDVPCGPCQKKVCPLGHHQCMTGVTVDVVLEACRGLLLPAATRPT